MKDIPIAAKIPECDIAIEAAIKAGDAILEIYNSEYKVSTKDDDSPVTDADLKSNEIIKKILSQSKHSILSEEDKDNSNRLAQETVWIIDPLDGTRDFVEKTGEFTVMIALIKNKRPILGVIGVPAEKTLFVAQKGAGAFRFSDNSWSKICTSSISDISRCRIVGSRHHLTDKEKAFIKKLDTANFESVGSSLKVTRISSGLAEAYITTTIKMKEWDTAASHCIISEAGGKMTDMSGRDITYNNYNIHHENGILATNGLVHEKIVEEFKKLNQIS